VTHIVTPKAFQTVATSFIDGSAFRTGVAFDVRPLARRAGSLQDYWQSPITRLKWRSVASFGTLPKGGDSKDVIVAGGLRLPIIDRADPRADRAHIDTIEKTMVKAYDTCPQPELTDPEPACTPEMEKAFAEVKKQQEEFLSSHWNATKFDIGVAASLRAQGGEVFSSDSLNGDRVALWAAYAAPLMSRNVQLTLSGKASAAKSDSAASETQRYISGAIIRGFGSSWLSIALEGASVWARYAGHNELNESWWHLAAFAEVRIPILDSWLGLAYGGDTSRREKPDARLSVYFAHYKDRILEK